MDKLNVKGLKDLLLQAKVDAEENKTKQPIFAGVPQKLRDFVSSANAALLEVKAQVHIDKLRTFNKVMETDGKGARSKTAAAEASNLDSPDPEKNLPHMINWIVEIVKHLYDKINEHGEILTVHTKAMAEPNAALVDPKDEIIENLQKKVKELSGGEE